MEILIYMLLAYLFGMFVTTAIVNIVDPYGYYLDETICPVMWPIAFPCWALFTLAALVRTLVDTLLD